MAGEHTAVQPEQKGERTQMKITPDTLVSEVLEARPDATKVFEKYGVHVTLECSGVLDNPLDLCETMCGIDDFTSFMTDLQTFMESAPEQP
ncbi:MAG: hypothetical protein K0R39_1517 [Symbiobacteriaceae bacterium]|nr:hypothetical protein [Symbiobacteriaceae bacterium]